MRLQKILDREELENVSMFVHGALFAFHALGAFYNLKRGKYSDAAIHTLVSLYDLSCVANHNNYRIAYKTKLDRMREAGM
ncbi:hypothetical protein LCGC14_1925260 [marine sediment metagenome]|uniref:Uncharacterized protein n=1 Tax=marine sediment metagenome TaxID=412755 RepID=A0A0F9IMF9_9ZZZZ